MGKFETSVLSDCSVQLTPDRQRDRCAQHIVERSTDGRNYEDIATIAADGNFSLP
jgi:hypothetical protein